MNRESMCENGDFDGFHLVIDAVKLFSFRQLNVKI